MISIIITAYKEPKTIEKAILSIADSKYSGFLDDIEIIQVSPDKETLDAGQSAILKLTSKPTYIQIQDPQKGKPFALNLALKKAQGEILVLTDGDVFFEKNALSILVSSFDQPNVFAVTGRPKAMNSKKSMMGYFANMLADAAHHKRIMTMTQIHSGKSELIIKRNKFFPMSGYIMAIRKSEIEIPSDCLADDAYISYVIANSGKKIVYNPDAHVFVKYPSNLLDYFNQKKRSLGGYIQLWKYGVVNKSTKSRSFWHEIQYFWFPIKYSASIKELIWSLMFYPVRLMTWLAIWWERKILKKDFERTWVRIESTK